jgi:Rad3-related DNA helicase
LSNRIPDYTSQEVSPKEFERFVISLNRELEEILEDMEGPLSPRDMKDDVEDLLSRCSWFLRSLGAGVEWIVDYTKDKYGAMVEAKPLDSSYFAKRMFFTNQANQYVLQSATIVNSKRYAKELGIEGDGVAFKMPIAFSAANRPLYPLNACKMNYESLEGNLPKIADTVRTVLQAHPGQKGIIHTGSYKIQKYLQDNLSFSRLIFPERGGVEDALALHKESKDPTVLVSPAVTEGVDGKDDLVRFQVVCKIPYPFLGDRRIKILANRDWGWYNYQAAKTLIQALGRGVRSETDWCKNYVLDDALEKFINQSNVGYYVNDCLQSTDEGWRSLK